MKKQAVSFLYFCIVCVINGGDCFGMKTHASNTDLNEKTSSLNNGLGSGRGTASNSLKNDDSSAEDKWIEEHKDLINRACFQEQGIIDLLLSLRQLSYLQASIIYHRVLRKWNNNNIYELVDTGDLFKGYYEKEDYDF